MNKYNIYCLLALMGTGLPVIASERGSPTEELPWVRIALRNATYPFASAVIFQTEKSRQFISGQAKLRRVAVIPNPVSRLIELHERRPEKMVLAVGRLHWMKGHSHLLEAFAAMTVRDWTLVVCGDGELRDKLEGQARELGIIERAHFPGAIKDLGPYFVRAGIFALSSLSEGFPNALAEAMVAGVPCVSYDCETGPSELIADGENGLLVPVGNKAAFARALDQLAMDPKWAQGLGVRAAQIADRVEIGAVSKEYWEVCASAASLRRN
jgi:glycosyltransferase involved in cell wall biosynthesis